MSRHTSLESTPTVARRAPGRHRLDAQDGVRCTDLPAVAARLGTAQPRTVLTFLRSLRPSVPAGRHTWDFLTNAGGRPRTAFAIILSL